MFHCHNCGYFHPPYECPFAPQRCRYCDEIGHFAQFCIPPAPPPPLAFGYYIPVRPVARYLPVAHYLPHHGLSPWWQPARMRFGYAGGLAEVPAIAPAPIFAAVPASVPVPAPAAVHWGEPMMKKAEVEKPEVKKLEVKKPEMKKPRADRKTRRQQKKEARNRDDEGPGGDKGRPAAAAGGVI